MCGQADQITLAERVSLVLTRRRPWVVFFPCNGFQELGGGQGFPSTLLGLLSLRGSYTLIRSRLSTTGIYQFSRSTTILPGWYPSDLKTLAASPKVLAAKQPTVKFLRLRSSAAEGGDYDPVALPTLLLYRAGEVVGCMTRVTDDIGDNFTQEDVEWLLQEHDVFEVRHERRGSLLKPDDGCSCLVLVGSRNVLLSAFRFWCDLVVSPNCFTVSFFLFAMDKVVWRL